MLSVMRRWWWVLWFTVGCVGPYQASPELAQATGMVTAYQRIDDNGNYLPDPSCSDGGCYEPDIATWEIDNTWCWSSTIGPGGSGSCPSHRATYGILTNNSYAPQPYGTMGYYKRYANNCTLYQLNGQPSVWRLCDGPGSGGPSFRTLWANSGGGDNGPLWGDCGSPIGNNYVAGGGQRQKFQRCLMFYTWNGSVWKNVYIKGPTLAKWYDRLAYNIDLGNAYDFEAPAPYGQWNTDYAGTYTNFNGYSGTANIHYRPNTGAKASYGTIEQKWASMTWEQGALGFPVTDVTSKCLSGSSLCWPVQYFQGGYIMYRDDNYTTQAVVTVPLRYNQVVMKGSHNSFEKKESYLDQLTYHRVHQLEVDLHSGTSFTDGGVTYQDWHIFHVSSGSSMNEFSHLLMQLYSWHALNPAHEVVTIFLDLHDNLSSANSHNAYALQKLIDHYLPYNPTLSSSMVLSPTHLWSRCSAATTFPQTVDGGTDPTTLNSTCVWPTLAALKGKFVFVITQGCWPDSCGAPSDYNNYFRPDLRSGANGGAHLFTEAQPGVFANVPATNSPDANLMYSLNNTFLRVYTQGPADCTTWANNIDQHVNAIAMDTVSANTCRRLTSVRGYPFLPHGQYETRGRNFASYVLNDMYYAQPSTNFITSEVASANIVNASYTSSFFPLNFVYRYRTGSATVNRTWFANISAKGVGGGLLQTDTDNDMNLSRGCLMLRQNTNANAAFYAVCRGADERGLRAYWRTKEGDDSTLGTSSGGNYLYPSNYFNSGGIQYWTNEKYYTVNDRGSATDHSANMTAESLQNITFHHWIGDAPGSPAGSNNTTCANFYVNPWSEFGNYWAWTHGICGFKNAAGQNIFLDLFGIATMSNNSLKVRFHYAVELEWSGLTSDVYPRWTTLGGDFPYTAVVGSNTQPNSAGYFYSGFRYDTSSIPNDATYDP